jgi:hypothetical protein
MIEDEDEKEGKVNRKEKERDWIKGGQCANDYQADITLPGPNTYILHASCAPLKLLFDLGQSRQSPLDILPEPLCGSLYFGILLLTSFSSSSQYPINKRIRDVDHIRSFAR